MHSPLPRLFARGSTWLRADFHLHTRANKEFVAQCATDADLNTFVGQYGEALQATQRAIVDFMEGGTEAFSKCKEIYRLWMSHNS